MIKRPMKAPSESISDEELQNIAYPIYGSPKLDGFRAMIGDKVYSSSMKPIPNKFVQSELSRKELYGLDGELIVGLPNARDPLTGKSLVFNNTSGPIRREEGEPDFKFFVFNRFEEPNEQYLTRWIQACNLTWGNIHPRVIVLAQRMLWNAEDVIRYSAYCEAQGYEGAMLASCSARYKEGRATMREGYCYKRKSFVDDEARIIGFEEMMENTNEKTVNELGLSKRSSHQAGLVPKGIVGKFIVKNKKWGEFNIGTFEGLTLEARKDIWNNKSVYLGQIIKFKYQKYGSLDKPRIPIGLAFRPDFDMTEEV